MADSDQLAAIGQKLTAALTSAYAGADPNAALVFVPGGVTVPGDIVQAGIVNPAQMETFLETNFDSPFLMSPSQCTVHGRDSSYGTSSEIYMIAATTAQPLGAPSDDSWKRVNAEIAAAQRNLPAPGVVAGFACEPDDWVLASNSGYWTVFDSSQAAVTPAPASQPVPAINPHLWVMRSATMMPLHLVAPVAAATASVSAAPAKPSGIAVAARTASLQVAPARAAAPAATEIWRRPISTVPERPTQTTGGASPKPAPPPEQSVSVRLEHQCVTLGYLAGGVPWWSAAFLADTGWYIPGMTRGALLPQPAADSDDLAYGRPVALIVVRNLAVTGNWTNESAASVGSMGPFSLIGATACANTNGTMTFARPGMQVIALLCSRLPVLPPADTPQAATVPASSTATQAAPPASPGASSSPQPAPAGDPQAASADTTQAATSPPDPGSNSAATPPSSSGSTPPAPPTTP